MIRFSALKSVSTSGGRNYPFFLGFLSAEELDQICDVPSFSEDTENHQIAAQLTPPIKRWQRPLNEAKRQQIQDKFSEDNEFMPNPVLLAVNRAESVNVRPGVNGTQTTGTFDISIETADSEEQGKPLWILDGQHRVRGLAQSSQSDNPIPLVLLHGSGSEAYPASDFAKVFAEVSTTTRPLEPLHRAWLQYAFNLDSFSPRPDGQPSAASKAMKAAALLCSEQQFGNPPKTNPLWNKIQFNPSRSVRAGSDDNFAFDAVELSELIQRSYYEQLIQRAQEDHLSPQLIAQQLAAAVTALRDIVQRPEHSCFFGRAPYGQKYLRMAYVHGVCKRILHQGIVADWAGLLRDLQFHVDWDLTQSIGSTGGTEGNTSRTVALNVFGQIFPDGHLPQDVTSIRDYLFGDKAEFKLELGSRPNQRASVLETKWIAMGRTQTQTLDSNIDWIRIESFTPNIARLKSVDERAPLDPVFHATSLRRGVHFDSNASTPTLIIEADHYGGVKTSTKLNLTRL